MDPLELSTNLKELETTPTLLHMRCMLKTVSYFPFSLQLFPFEFLKVLQQEVYRHRRLPVRGGTRTPA